MLKKGCPEGRSPGASLSAGVVQGRNSWGQVGDRGPCPPGGQTHRYRFRLFALDRTLELEPGVSKGELLEAAGNSILAETILVGAYER